MAKWQDTETGSFRRFRLLHNEGASVWLNLYCSGNIWDNESPAQYRFRDGKTSTKWSYAKAENYDTKKSSAADHATAYEYNIRHIPTAVRGCIRARQSFAFHSCFLPWNMK